MSRDLIPWGEVGPGWYLVTYVVGGFDAATGMSIPGSRTILYLVDARGLGVLYEVLAWESGTDARIADWRLDGSAALIWRTAPTGERDLVFLEIASAEQQVIVGRDLLDGLGYMERFSYNWPNALIDPLYIGDVLGYGDQVRFTTPKGVHLVARTADGTTETLAYYNTAGTRLQELYSQPNPASPNHSLRWLYGAEGMDLVVAHAGGVALVDNKGQLIRDLWVPEDTFCAPVRWWSQDQFLAACTGQQPTFPHEFYHQLWLLRTDGSPGEPLTGVPQDAHPIELGYTDAWPVLGGMLFNRTGGCAANSTEFVGSASAQVYSVTNDTATVDVFGETRMVHDLAGCENGRKGLSANDLGTGEVTKIISQSGANLGVTTVFGLASVYP